MAIEKMIFIKIVGSLNEMHKILKQLVLTECVHMDFEENSTYEDNLILHEYESILPNDYDYSYEKVDYDSVRQKCQDIEAKVEKLCQNIGIELKAEIKHVADYSYNLNEAYENLENILKNLNQRLEEFNSNKDELEKLENFLIKLQCIEDKTINFRNLTDLRFFDYEIGTLSQENKARMKRNYEKISAVAMKIGNLKSSVEDLYIVIYPKQYREENEKVLKSLNWNKLSKFSNYDGTAEEIIYQVQEKIFKLKTDLNSFYKEIETNKSHHVEALNKIYTTVKLEKKIYELERNVVYSDNIFVINAWASAKDEKLIEDSIKEVTSDYLLTHKTPEEISKFVMPPTKLKNNWFSKPFEAIVKLYGLPSYNEIDPTTFLSITFFLMFGIMFGDIGQGAVYFLAGVLLSKKMKLPGQILKRLGFSSICFGFVYGSLFGLEHEQLPWLPSLTGPVLSPDNIMPILLMGVTFGVVVLTVSFVIGIINNNKKKNYEEAIFGKNGVAGYVFFMSMIFSALCITSVINVSVSVPVSTLLISLVVMIAKHPLANLMMKKRPLIHGTLGEYLTESIFEGVETVLGTLSNAISFIRVGAFALNHAGLFLAFLVMAEQVTSPILKLFILFMGNILILTLEGLIVFIQGLRLEYYEMFSKYFDGNGIEFNPIKLSEE